MGKPWLKNYPLGAPHNIPPLKGGDDIVSRFLSAADEFQDQAAFVSFGAKLSYKDLKKLSFQLAGFFQQRGLQPGDRVALQLPNIPQYPASLWAVFLSGLTAVNISPIAAAAEALFILKDSHAKAIVLLSSLRARLEEIISQTHIHTALVTEPGDLLTFPKNHAINLAFRRKQGAGPIGAVFPSLASGINAGAGGAKGGPIQTISFLKALKKGAEGERPLASSSGGSGQSVPFLTALRRGISKPPRARPRSGGKKPRDAKAAAAASMPQIKRQPLESSLLIQYTGGVTGVAKGAELSQANILSNLRQCEAWMRPFLERGGERALAPLPLTHSFAFLVSGLLLFLYGAETVLIANPRDIPSLIRTLKKYPVTVGVTVGTLCKALLDSPNFQEADFSLCRFLIAGGMSLSAPLKKRWRDAAGAPLIEGYGLTEASPVVSCGSLAETDTAAHAGYPLPSTSARVVDEKGAELPCGATGELEIMGPQVISQYWKNEAETARAFHGPWLRTGDIARFDSKGRLVIVDRKKDMINVSGKKVFPAEVEEALLRHPSVQGAAATGFLDQREETERVKAFVQIKPGFSPSDEDLRAYCKKLLSPYKIPKSIEFVERLPRTELGKPLRRLFRQKSGGGEA